MDNVLQKLHQASLATGQGGSTRNSSLVAMPIPTDDVDHLGFVEGPIWLVPYCCTGSARILQARKHLARIGNLLGKILELWFRRMQATVI